MAFGGDGSLSVHLDIVSHLSVPPPLPSSLSLLSSFGPRLVSAAAYSPRSLTLPSTVADFWSAFSTASPPPRLQHALTTELDTVLLSAHTESLSSSPAAHRAFISASHDTSRYWLSSLPTGPTLTLSDKEFIYASRLRLFLPPSDSLPSTCCCPSAPLLASDPAHFLSCSLLKDLRRVRHDRLCRLLASLIQRCGGVAQVEPSHFPAGRPDILAYLPAASYIIDGVFVHPSSPSYLSLPAVPLHCAHAAERRKASHYSSTHTSDECKLVPFAMETYGAFGDVAHSFVAMLAALSRESVSPSLDPPPLFSSLAILLQKCNAFILSRGIVLSRTSIIVAPPS